MCWLSADDFLILPLSGGGQVLVAWVDNSTTAVLAWRAADNATAAMAASSVDMSATSFLGSAFANATVNNATLNPFQQALQGSPDTDEDLAAVCKHWAFTLLGSTSVSVLFMLSLCVLLASLLWPLRKKANVTVRCFVKSCRFCI